MHLELYIFAFVFSQSTCDRISLTALGLRVSVDSSYQHSRQPIAFSPILLQHRILEMK